MQEFLTRISPHFSNRSICKSHWIVVVNISNSILETAKRLSNWCIVIVVRDQQNTNRFQTNVFYLTTAIQNELAKISTFFEITHHLSEHHYAVQKNAGYFWAILHNATIIWDFNHDNKLIGNERTFLSFNEQVDALTVPNHRSTLFNPYPFFFKGTKKIWPRGFPRGSINDSYKNFSEIQTLSGYWPTKNIGIIQSLADGNGDIDLSNRLMTHDVPMQLKKLSKDPNKDVKLIIPRRSFSPYNEQATLHLRSALWMLLLPITVDRQLSDIWRSYIMQRLMWDVGLQIAFAGPYIIKPQHKSYDNNQSTEESYLKIDKLVKFLTEWSSNETSLIKRAEQLYIDLYKQSYIEINDVYLIRLWFNELRQYDYIFPTIASKYTVAVRTFSGHLDRMNQWYIPTVNMFVDRNVFDVLFVLDDESQNDHVLGECLKQHNFSVKYEPLPTFAKRINLKGYDRQQWSTFYMDQLSNSDYIGVIDADGIIFSFMHPFYSIFASDDDKRIMLKPMVGDHYKENHIALKFDSGLDFMWTDRMPMWYRWETYPNLRNYISSAWNISNFDDAFIEFSKNQRYSQFTIISSYASRFETNYYRIIMDTDTRGAVSVGSNRGRDPDIRIGCCRSFNIGCNHSSMPETNEDHLLRFANTNFVAINATEKTNIYYDHVHNYLKQMPMHMVLDMKQNCRTVLDNKSMPICV